MDIGGVRPQSKRGGKLFGLSIRHRAAANRLLRHRTVAVSRALTKVHHAVCPKLDIFVSSSLERMAPTDDKS